MREGEREKKMNEGYRRSIEYTIIFILNLLLNAIMSYYFIALTAVTD